MNFQGYPPYEAPDIKISCVCGARIQSKNKDQHERSMSHYLKLQSEKHLREKGGSNGLTLCGCRLYVAWKVMSQHLRGIQHMRQISLRRIRTPVCPECKVNYDGSYQYHLTTNRHFKNKFLHYRFTHQNLHLE